MCGVYIDRNSVGIAGHALHGGYGFTSRTYGLTLDTFIGATVILANGTRTYAADGEGGDNQLMWALRGAGSSYGIVVELDFQTIKAPDIVTPFSIELEWNENQAVEGLIAFQKFAANAPKQLNMQIYIGPSGQTIRGVYYGTRAALNTALKPLLGDIDAQISASTTGGWIEGLKAYANGQTLDQRRPYNQVSKSTPCSSCSALTPCSTAHSTAQVS
jgi:FAD/FMN-containing dehydrogenase